MKISRTIIVSNNTACIDTPIYLYKGDGNVLISLDIINITISTKLNQMSTTSYINDNISYATACLCKRDSSSTVHIVGTKVNDKIELELKKDMMDETVEVGEYRMQVHLFDKENNRLTIPVVEEINIMLPLCSDGYVPPVAYSSKIGEATVDYSKVVAESISASSDFYHTYNWTTGEYITANKLNNMITGIDEALYDIKNIQNNYVTKSELSNKANKEEIPTKISQLLNDKGYLTEHQDLSNYATKFYVDSEIANAQLEGGEVDLSGYATEIFVQQQIEGIEHPEYDDTELREMIETIKVPSIEGLATEQFVQSEIAKAQLGGENGEVDLSAYATKNYVDTEIEEVGLKVNEDIITLNDDINSMMEVVNRHEEFFGNTSQSKIEVNYGERTTPRPPVSIFTGWAIPFSKSVFTGKELTYFSISLIAYDNSTDKNVINDVPVSLVLVDSTPREGTIKHDVIEVLSRTILKESGTVEFEFNKPLSELSDNFKLGVKATAQCNLQCWKATSNDSYPLKDSMGALYTTNITEMGEWQESNTVGYITSDFKVGTDGGTAILSHKHNIEDIEGLDDLVSSKVKLSLPDKYELIVGDTFELFYKGILLTNNPYNYNIQIQCDKGAYYSRKYMFTPMTSDIGTHNMTIFVYDDNETLLDSKTVKLVVKNKAVSPSTIKNVLCIGDSLTSGGAWPREVHRRLTESGGTPVGDGLSNINFIGTCKNNTTGFEGYGGWSYTAYNTNSVTQQHYWIMTTANKPLTYQKSVWQDNNGVQWVLETIESNRIKIYRNVYGTQLPPASGSLTWIRGGDGSANDTITYTSYEDETTNPFWNNTTNMVDFEYYANELGVSSIDHCYVLLGWNQTSQSENDFKEGVRTFVNNLRASFPNCKIVLMGLQVPSIDGFGSNYGCNWNFYDKLKVVFNMNKWNYEITKEFDNMDFINIAGQFDTENNMLTSTRPVNVRNSETEVYGTNGVHPATSGQLQIADAVYRHLSQNL